MESIFGLLFFGFALVVFMLIGKGIELHHYKQLEQQETAFKGMIVTNLKTIPPQFENRQAFLVIGSAVIATDYFKAFAANVRNFFGGEIKSYVSLMERARRQATLRMLEQAAQYGANVVWNVRYQTSSMNANERKPGGVEIIVYGTAIK